MMSSFRKYIRTLENRKLPPVKEGHPILVKYGKQKYHGVVSRITKSRLFIHLMSTSDTPFSLKGKFWETEYNFKTDFCGSEIYEVFDKATGMEFREYLKNV